MGRRKRGRSVRRNTAHSSTKNAGDDEALAKAPHSFVVHRGTVGKAVAELVRDFRRVMEPNTASNIKVRPRNVVRDFVHVAGALGVSHLAMFTRTELGPYLKVGRFPRGPTLTFRVRDYTLARDVRSSLKRQVTYEKQYLTAPLLILNNFTGSLPEPKLNGEEEEGKNEPDSGGRAMELLASMLQNMFPSINVNTVKVNSIRRCVLLNYDSETDLVDFRHYTIKVVPVGVNRGIKKIVQGKVPNLSRYNDMSEFLGAGGNMSESEAEDDETSKVTLPQAVSSRGNVPQQRSSVRLVELGPRMTLEPIKVEEGLLEGEVLYHKLVAKTDEEKKVIRATREKRKRARESRRKEQEANVKKKQEAKDKHREKSIKGMKKLAHLPEGFHDGRADEDGSDDDDAKWYEKEVGEKPEKDMFDDPAEKRSSRKRSGGKMNAGSVPKRFKKSLGKGRGSDRGARDGSSRGRGGGSSGRGRGGVNRRDAKGSREAKGARRASGGKRTLKGQFSKQGIGPNFKRKKS